MAITFKHPEIEKRLHALAKRQIVPVSRHAMMVAILKAALDDDRGQPIEKWREQAAEFGAQLRANATDSNPVITPTPDVPAAGVNSEPAEQPQTAKAAAGHSVPSRPRGRRASAHPHAGAA